MAIFNQKGGVGKTTTVINMGAALAVLDKKVLLVDFDSQGNLSSGLGFSGTQTIYGALQGCISVEKVVEATEVPRMSLLPADLNLAGWEMEIFTQQRREYLLRDLLQPLLGLYDYVLLDCPPALNLLTVNALVASCSLLIPLQCEFFALEGLSHLLETVERLKTNFNGGLFVEGILLTMYDRRNKLTEQVEYDVRQCLGDLVFKTVIPRNVKLVESTSFGVPALIHDRHCAGSEAYVNFVAEMVVKHVD
jgi:chromosome partitioning protein